MVDAGKKAFCVTSVGHVISSAPFAVVSPSFRTAPSIPSVSVSRGLYQKLKGVTMDTRAAMLVQGRERWKSPMKNSIIPGCLEMAMYLLTRLVLQGIFR